VARSDPSVEELRSPGFALLRAMRHDELVEFAIEYFFRRPSWLTRLHHAISIATIIAAIAVTSGVMRAMIAFSAATLTMFVVILPLHEAIHAVAYWIVGARRIRWGVIPRMLAAYVVADDFVANRATFVAVALAPFFVINGALIWLAIAWPAYGDYFLWVLLWHIAGVSGDWALLNFYWLQRRREIYTLDQGGVSYFYARALP
jgi:hypothetical protein